MGKRSDLSWIGEENEDLGDGRVNFVGVAGDLGRVYYGARIVFHLLGRPGGGRRVAGGNVRDHQRGLLQREYDQEAWPNADAATHMVGGCELDMLVVWAATGMGGIFAVIGGGLGGGAVG